MQRPDCLLEEITHDVIVYHNLFKSHTRRKIAYLSILYYQRGAGGLSPSEIMEFYSVVTNSVYNYMEDLEKEGLIKRIKEHTLIKYTITLSGTNYLKEFADEFWKLKNEL